MKDYCTHCKTEKVLKIGKSIDSLGRTYYPPYCTKCGKKYGGNAIHKDIALSRPYELKLVDGDTSEWDSQQ